MSVGAMDVTCGPCIGARQQGGHIGMQTFTSYSNHSYIVKGTVIVHSILMSDVNCPVTVSGVGLGGWHLSFDCCRNSLSNYKREMLAH